MSRPLIKYQQYTREDVHDIFSPNTPFIPQRGTWGLHGIIKVPNRPRDFVFFVTYGSRQGGHTFEEGITEQGIFTWQSQPAQSLITPMILDLINHNDLIDNIYLFLRPTKQVRSYSYLGTLAYLEHDSQREKPVYFKWQILDWSVTPELAKILGITFSEKQNDIAFPISTHPSTQTAALEKTPPPTQRPNIRGGLPTNLFRSLDIDFVENSKRNNVLGTAGENAIIKMEKDGLINAGHPELAELVESTRDSLGNTAPYDVLSYTLTGEMKFIEVKTTKGNIYSPFYISQREVSFSKQYAENYYLYRVYEFNSATNTGKFFIMKGDIAEYCKLQAISYKATLY